MLNYNLKTKYYHSFSQDEVLKDYPRPQFVRDSYLNLNGVWQLGIANKKDTDIVFDKEIVVPYVIESALSGLRLDLQKDEVLWYRKVFNIPKDMLLDHIILHLDGVFQICDIYLNGVFIKHSNNPYQKIEIEISHLIKDENVLVVKVENKPDYRFAVSKEGHKRGGMWYTKTTGIYKTVWLESYLEEGIKNIKLETDIEGFIYGSISANTNKNTITIMHMGEVIQTKQIENDFVLQINEPKLWSPDEPNLYDVIIDNGYERVRSYVSFREIKIHNKKIYLNGNETFINGVLNQSYFSDGIFTPANYHIFKDDIMLAKQKGFNAIRMHIKREADIFYYYCDKYGMLVMQDFPNIGSWNFMKHALLPTIFKHLPFGSGKVKKETKLAFLESNMEMIDELSGFACIFYYTIFNEGWGQFEAKEMYKLFKDEYPQYIFDTTSGWFDKKATDTKSIHNYFFKLKVPKTNKIVILSEYGGYGLKIHDHSFNEDKIYGYKNFSSKEELKVALDELFAKIEKLKKQGLAGAVYTQLSDIEDEVNGLVTYDREIIKY